MKLRGFHGPEGPVCPNLAKFGSYLATIWPNLVMKFFFGRARLKVKEVCGFSFKGCFIKKLSYWTWQLLKMSKNWLIARSNNSFF